MTSPSRTKLNTTVYEVVRISCRNGESPLAVALSLCERLRNDPTWTDDEVDRVQVAAEEILQHLTQPAAL